MKKYALGAIMMIGSLSLLLLEPSASYTAYFVILTLITYWLLEFADQRRNIGFRWIFHKNSNIFLKYRYDKRTGQLLGRVRHEMD